jgi:hypothetical protein
MIAVPTPLRKLPLETIMGISEIILLNVLEIQNSSLVRCDTVAGEISMF